MTVRARWEERLWTFKSPTETVTHGDTTLTPFVEDFQAWVFVQPLSGNEESIGDQVQTSRTHLCTMRYDSRVRERMQLHRENRTLEIIGILDIDERNIELQLTCKEIV